jgi:hypothetical protein
LNSLEQNLHSGIHPLKRSKTAPTWSSGQTEQRVGRTGQVCSRWLPSFVFFTFEIVRLKLRSGSF